MTLESKILKFMEVFNVELINGTIHSISDGTVKTGHFAGSSFKTITLTTGNKLSAFELPFIDGVEIGKEYTFPVEQKGTYVNIVGTVTPVIQQNMPPHEPTQEEVIADGDRILNPRKLGQVAKPAEEVLPKVHTPTDEREFKNRISAISASVEFLVGALGKTESILSIGEVVFTAEEFLKFIKGE